MGRGVPAGPPRVSASMKPRTTALLRAVPNSSSVYLSGEKTHATLKAKDAERKDTFLARGRPR